MPLLLDLVLVAVLLLAAAVGWRRGGVSAVVRLAGAGFGLFAGLAVARLLSTSLSPVGHVVLGVACAAGGLLVGRAAGRRFGARLKGHTPHGLRNVDRLAGAGIGVGTALVACGLIASSITAFAPPSVAAEVNRAALLPPSASELPVVGALWNRVAHTFQSGAPSDLAALVPAAADAMPSTAVVADVQRQVGSSVVQVAVSRCGAGVTGTAFAVGNHTLVTNAHVVAGADSVTVAGAQAIVVAFDRRTDLAILRASGLDRPALRLARVDAANGTAAVVVGYPENEPQAAVAAAVLQRMPLPNPGFVGRALHEAYRLHVSVRHGNSGSPVFDVHGHVVGVVNALSSSSSHAGHEGYAISVDELRRVLDRADGITTPVSVGDCPQ